MNVYSIRAVEAQYTISGKETLTLLWGCVVTFRKVKKHSILNVNPVFSELNASNCTSIGTVWNLMPRFNETFRYSDIIINSAKISQTHVFTLHIILGSSCCVCFGCSAGCKFWSVQQQLLRSRTCVWTWNSGHPEWGRSSGKQNEGRVNSKAYFVSYLS